MRSVIILASILKNADLHPQDVTSMVNYLCVHEAIP